MSKKINNKWLLIILASLAGIWVLTELLHKQEKNLKTDLVAIKTEEISKIIFYSKSSDKPVIVKKKGETGWEVSEGEKSYIASSEIVEAYINELQKIKSQRLAAKSKDKWKEFEVTDSAAIRIKLYNAKDKKLTDLLIGKFSYKQGANPYGRNNVTGISYVRLADEKETYAVDGFLPMSLNKRLDDWRDKTICKLNKDDIRSIKFTYPADSSYMLEYKDSLWFMGNTPIDKKTVESYLSSLQNKNGFEFNNDFQPVSNPVYQLKIEGNNLSNVDIKCYDAGNGKFVLHSDQNTEAFFSSDANGLVKQLFKPQKEFLSVNQ